MSTQFSIAKPDPGEYAPYYEKYVSLISGGDLLSILDRQMNQVVRLFAGRSEADGDNRYLPEKWSVKEVLGHIIDTERIMAYRALRIARGDKSPIEGFEQDDYVRNGPFGHCRLSDLVEEFMHVRRATVALFRNLDEPAITRKGIANKQEISRLDRLVSTGPWPSRAEWDDYRRCMKLNVCVRRFARQ